MADITKYNSIKDIPSDQIFDRSKNGKTVVLVDGTRVSDELIAKAKALPKAKAAANPATAQNTKDPFDEAGFVRRVSAIAEEEARKAVDSSLSDIKAFIKEAVREAVASQTKSA
jgi:hypothetical protein